MNVSQRQCWYDLHTALRVSRTLHVRSNRSKSSMRRNWSGVAFLPYRVSDRLVTGKSGDVLKAPRMTSSFADSDCVARSWSSRHLFSRSAAYGYSDSSRWRGTTGFVGLRNAMRASACSLGFSSFCTILRPVIGRARIRARHQEQQATTNRNTMAIATVTTAAAIKPALVRVENAAVETRAIYGRVRQIRQEKLGLSQISRYARNPGPICNAIKRRGEIRIVRDREKKCKTACRKQTHLRIQIVQFDFNIKLFFINSRLYKNIWYARFQKLH